MEMLPRAVVGSGFFKDRFASPEVGEHLAAVAPELEAALQPFKARYPRVLQQLAVTPERIECTLDFGRPPHLTVDTVLELVPAIVRLARLIEGEGLRGGSEAGPG
jgi:hypothetical protein